MTPTRPECRRAALALALVVALSASAGAQTILSTLDRSQLPLGLDLGVLEDAELDGHVATIEGVQIYQADGGPWYVRGVAIRPGWGWCVGSWFAPAEHLPPVDEPTLFWWDLGRVQGRTVVTISSHRHRRDIAIGYTPAGAGSSCQ